MDIGTKLLVLQNGRTDVLEWDRQHGCPYGAYGELDGFWYWYWKFETPMTETNPKCRTCIKCRLHRDTLSAPANGMISSFVAHVFNLWHPLTLACCTSSNSSHSSKLLGFHPSYRVVIVVVGSLFLLDLPRLAAFNSCVFFGACAITSTRL